MHHRSCNTVVIWLNIYPTLCHIFTVGRALVHPRTVSLSAKTLLPHRALQQKGEGESSYPAVFDKEMKIPFQYKNDQLIKLRKNLWSKLVSRKHKGIDDHVDVPNIQRSSHQTQVDSRWAIDRKVHLRNTFPSFPQATVLYSSRLEKDS